MNEKMIKILKDVMYWDTCPEDYKNEIKAFLSCENEKQVLNKQNVINSGLPEWLDEATRAEAAELWNTSNSVINNRVKATRLLQERAKDFEYTITLKKGLEILKSYCL